MQQRIISNPNDMMGILLFGTQRSKFHDDDETKDGRHHYPHCYLLADLDKPAASDIKRLRSLVDNEEESNRLLVPSAEPATMANLLFCANQIFTTKAANFSSRRLFLVTDDDNPHASNKSTKSSSIVRAKDLFDLGVTIELFPISQPGSDFDTSKFFDVGFCERTAFLSRLSDARTSFTDHPLTPRPPRQSLKLQNRPAVATVSLC